MFYTRLFLSLFLRCHTNIHDSTFISDLCAALIKKFSVDPKKGKSYRYPDVNEDNSSFPVGWDNQTQENTKESDKERGMNVIQSKGGNEKDSKNEEPTEDEIGNVREGIIREAKLAVNNYLLQVSLPEKKLGANSNIVCVLTDCSGAVLELWSSDNDFTLEYPDDDAYFSLTTANKYTAKDVVPTVALKSGGFQFCKRCFKASSTNDKLGFCSFCDKSFEWNVLSTTYNENFVIIHFQLPGMAKHLFQNGYKLLSSCSFDNKYNRFTGDKGTVLYHVFVD